MKKYWPIFLTLLVLVPIVLYVTQLRQPQGDPPQSKNQPNLEEYPDFGGAHDVKLLPVDEGKENPDFTRFRDQLLAAIKRKDLAFLKAHLHQDIKYTFGKNQQIQGFFRFWELDTNPNESTFWQEMEAVLSLGGTFNEERTLFTAPYTFTKFPEELDAFQHVVIIDRDVPVYAEPDLAAPVIGVLDYSIVKVLEHKVDENSWLKIENFSGASGFVQKQHARSPLDYRGSFQKNGDIWQLIFFVAGD